MKEAGNEGLRSGVPKVVEAGETGNAQTGWSQQEWGENRSIFAIFLALLICSQDTS